MSPCNDTISGQSVGDETNHIELHQTTSQQVGPDSGPGDDEQEPLFRSSCSMRSDAEEEDEDANLTIRLLEKCKTRDTFEIKQNMLARHHDNDRREPHQAAKKLANQVRKLSQSSSQVSSSFATTSAASSRRSSSVTQLTSPPVTHRQDASDAETRHPAGYKTAANGKQSGMLRGLSADHHRTISQSMLELDNSSRAEKFRISWRNLSFKYQPSWPNRCVRKLKSLVNFTCPGRQQVQSTAGPGAHQPPVLRDISGSFESNQLVAVIGPSGCGKTTLLQFLAGNISHQSDRLKIVGLSEPKVTIIGQDDCLLPGLTARETLVYASRLQNSLDKNFNHQRHIEPILSELGLSECSNRNVTKLSGGQMKRVTIAQELLYPTNLLILDEVTSGLDASTSFAIVKLLKSLVSDSNYPMSIVMSIHQPSARLFSVFDRVYVMGEGACLYEGSCQIGHINKYLERFGLECPKWHNIADYLIEIACEDSSEQVRQQMVQFQRKQHLEQLVATRVAGNHVENSATKRHYQFSQRPMATSGVCGVAALLDCEKGLGPGDRLIAAMAPAEQVLDLDQDQTNLFDAIEQARARKQRPFLAQFLVHFSRSLLRIRRSYILTYLQLITYVLLGLQLATFYGADIGSLSGCPRFPSSLASYVLASSSSSQAGSDELAQEMRRIQENMNFLLVTVMTATFAALEITVITFPLEAKTVRREWRNGWYRVSSYFMGRTMADLPFQLLFVVMFCLVVYSMTGQIGLDSWRFGAFVLTIVFTALIAQSFGFIFGAVFMNNLPAAVFTAPLCIFPALLFSGFFSRVSQIPAFYKPLTYFSHFRYAFDALLVTLYGFERCECDQGSLTNYHLGLENQTSSMRDMFRYLFGSSECPPSVNSNDNAAGQQQDHIGTTMEPQQGPAPDGNLVDQDDFEVIQRASQERKNQSIAEALSMARQYNEHHHHHHNHQESRLLVRGERSAGHQGGQIQSLEDVLVDSVFERLQTNHSSLVSSSMGSNATTGATQLLYSNLTTSGGLHQEPPAGAQVDFGQGVTEHLAQVFSTKLTTMLNKQANFGHPIPERCTEFNSYLMNEFNLHDNDLIFGLLMLFAIALITRLLCHFILNFTIATRAN